MLSTLNLHNVKYQLYVKKAGKKRNCSQQMQNFSSYTKVLYAFKPLNITYTILFAYILSVVLLLNSGVPWYINILNLNSNKHA